MKVLTKYPVYIDKKKVSNADFYMNAEGEKIYTKYPVYINGQKVASGDFYMNFDSNGKPTSKEEWKSFQNWYNAKGYSPKLTVDGVPGAMTNTAWSTYGSAFVSDAKALISTLSGSVSGTPLTPSSGEPTQQQKDEAAKKGIQWDKVKGWVTTAAQAGQQSGLWDILLNKAGITPAQPTTPISTEGGGSPTSFPGSTTTTEDEAKKKRKKMLIIGGVALVLVVTAVVLLTRKSSQPTPAPAK